MSRRAHPINYADPNDPTRVIFVRVPESLLSRLKRQSKRHKKSVNYAATAAIKKLVEDCEAAETKGEG